MATRGLVPILHQRVQSTALKLTPHLPQCMGRVGRQDYANCGRALEHL